VSQGHEHLQVVRADVIHDIVELLDQINGRDLICKRVSPSLPAGG